MTSRNLVSIACIFLVVIAVYAKVSMAFYCGYDDFTEIHRAAFEDTQHPSRIFTTTHFITSKYRPLNRTLTFLTYWVSHNSPLVFRFRNLAFHLLGVAAVFALGQALFRSWSVSVAAALLFGLHPLANQTVVAAVFTITASDFLMLLAFLFFVYALQSRDRQMLWLLLSILTTWVSLFVYEATVTIFGFLYGYLAIEWLWRRKVLLNRAFLPVLMIGSAAILASFLICRMLFVSLPTHLTPLGLILKNVMLYAGVLLLPLDLVLSHDLFGTPLPSAIRLGGFPLPFLLVLAVSAAVVLGLVLFFRRQLAARLATVEWKTVLFLCAGIGMSLAPFIAFNPHPSETYLHFPAAIYSLVLAAILRRLLTAPLAYAAAVAVFALLFAAATWDRNERVAACGAIAHRIVDELPLARWRQGSWDIRLSPFPGEPAPVRYGMYGYHGLSTIDVGEPEIPSSRYALQLMSGNENLNARAVSSCAIGPPCPPGSCFWIHSDGRVQEAPGGQDPAVPPPSPTPAPGPGKS